MGSRQKKGFRQDVKNILPEPFAIEFHRFCDPAGLLALGSLPVQRLPMLLCLKGLQHSGWDFPAEPARRLQRWDRRGITPRSGMLGSMIQLSRGRVWVSDMLVNRNALSRDHRIALSAKAFHGAFDPVTAPEIDRGVVCGADAGRRARSQDITGQERNCYADKGN